MDIQHGPAARTYNMDTQHGLQGHAAWTFNTDMKPIKFRTGMQHGHAV
jgi:hypothetical protein